MINPVSLFFLFMAYLAGSDNWGLGTTILYLCLAFASAFFGEIVKQQKKAREAAQLERWRNGQP